MNNQYEIPNYILKALNRRRNAARDFQNQDYIISQYCLGHNIDTEMINGATECIIEPDVAYDQTIQDILKHFAKDNSEHDSR